MGKTFQDVTYPDDLKNDVEDIRRLLAGEISSYQIEKRCLNKSGSIIWVQLSVCLALR
jgi:PAS domain S-box-containing protein